MKPNQMTKDPFEQREIVSEEYWKDPRWEEVKRLRREGPDKDIPRSNGIVMEIRADWGVD